MEILSSAFKPGKSIPSKYTCDGMNISTPLNWQGVPDGTKSLALIKDDPDAPIGTWVHWIVYNIPPDAQGLQENQPHVEILKDNCLQGHNTSRQIGYAGPLPAKRKPPLFF